MRIHGSISVAKLAFLGLTITAAALAGDLSFKVAGLRVMPKRWDKQGNLAKFERHARDAARQGAQVIITPEGFLDGYVGNDSILDKGVTREKYLTLGETLEGPSLKRVRHLARELKVHIVFGFPERDPETPDSLYNALVVYRPDGTLIEHYRKSHILDERFNAEGSKLSVFDTVFGRWGTLICYDRQLPETARVLALKGAQFILVPSYGGYGDMNTAMMRTRANENSVYVAFVHPKRCLFIDPRGNIIAQDDPQGGDQVVMTEIRLDHERMRKGAIRHRKPAMYGALAKP